MIYKIIILTNNSKLSPNSDVNNFVTILIKCRIEREY